MLTDLDRQAAFGKALAAYEDATSSSWIEPLEVAVNVAIDAVAPLIAAQARREALEEAAGVLEEEAADWIADANDAGADGHPRIAADFRRWAKEASKRARRIRALASLPAPPKET